MKNRFFAIGWQIVCIVLAVGSTVVFGYHAYRSGGSALLLLAIGLLVGVIIAPIFHETGHVLVARSVQMECVYYKAFCFSMQRDGKKRTWRLVSPFLDDQTQVVPQKGGDMQRRAIRYTLGGLLLSGVVLAGLIAAIALTRVTQSLWIGATIPTAYLFLMNVLPLAYFSGKTDILIYRGLKRGEPAEKAMVAAMEIQGRLFEGDTFSEIDATWYVMPPLCEDEPLFSILLDLQYRRELDRGDIEQAAMRLNRLAQLQPYLTQEELQSTAAELVYMHSMTGDLVAAEKNLEIAATFLERETATAKRILSAYYFEKGDKERGEALRICGLSLCEKEHIKGIARFEERLLKR